MGTIIFIAVIIIVLSLIPAPAGKNPRKRYRSRRSHGLPWLGGNRRKKNNRYFWD